MPPHPSPLVALHTPPGAYECSLVPLRRRGRGKSKKLKARKSKRAANWLPVAFALLPVTLPLRPLAGGEGWGEVGGHVVYASPGRVAQSPCRVRLRRGTPRIRRRTSRLAFVS